MRFSWNNTGVREGRGINFDDFKATDMKTNHGKSQFLHFYNEIIVLSLLSSSEMSQRLFAVGIIKQY